MIRRAQPRSHTIINDESQKRGPTETEIHWIFPAVLNSIQGWYIRTNYRFRRDVPFIFFIPDPIFTVFPNSSEARNVHLNERMNK